MFTAIYREIHGKPDVDILATRDTRLTDAMADVSIQAEGPGGLRLATASRVSRLLEKAQANLDAWRDLIADTPLMEGSMFTHKDAELGHVSVTWLEVAA